MIEKWPYSPNDAMHKWIIELKNPKAEKKANK
jgi:hypothetical protein